jgi:hypothetical protein
VSVAHSTSDGQTFGLTPGVAGVPLDDRPWISAFGPRTSLLSYLDAIGQLDVLRSDDGGNSYQQISQAIPPLDYKSGFNEIGNIVIDHRNRGGTVPGPNAERGFWAYQSFVAPSKPSGLDFNQAWVATSKDGGFDWADHRIPCSASATSLDHAFPNVSVAPDGTLWAAWSNDRNVYTAVSRNHARTWTCSGRVSTNTEQAIFPWIVATSRGVDLVYYASPTGPNGGRRQHFYVYFAQNLSSTAAGWRRPEQLIAVHIGAVCEQGATCESNRQLFDDFGIDTDRHGWAHIAYSHDSPFLGDQGSYTGYAVQTGGVRVGAPNN